MKHDEEWKRLVIIYNPFEGDFGDGEVRLEDKIVKTGKDHPECHVCGLSIKKGTDSRVMKEVSHGEMDTFRWCEDCCDAMAKSWEDSGRSIEKRYAMRGLT